MRIFFSVGIELYPTDQDLTYIDEVTFLNDLEIYREFLRPNKFHHQCGVLHIETDDHAKTSIEDELHYMISHVCFRAAPVLLSGQSYIFLYTETHNITAQLMPARDNIHISGKYVAPIIAPTYPLLQALYECGLRYLDFLLKLDEAQHRFPVMYMRHEAAHARTALGI